MEKFCLIPLTQGKSSIVDCADFDWLNQWKWYAYWNPCTRSFYARRDVWNGTRCVHIPMHRQILGLEEGNPLQGDHKEPSETLDNRRSNLRLATRQQNMQNRRIQKNNKCGFKGVSYHKNTEMWRAQIKVNGKQITLGRRKTAEAAYLELYVPAAHEYYGEFARVR